MNDCRFSISPVNYPEPDPVLFFFFFFFFVLFFFCLFFFVLFFCFLFFLGRSVSILSEHVNCFLFSIYI